MIKFIIFFRKPADAALFEEKFSNHVRLINAMPNLRRTVVNRVISAPRGEALYYLIHEAFFEDMPALNYALNSPEGRAAGADLLSWARDLTTMLYAEVWGEEFPPAPIVHSAVPVPDSPPAAAAQPGPTLFDSLMPEPAPITETISEPTVADAAAAAVAAIAAANNTAPQQSDTAPLG